MKPAKKKVSPVAIPSIEDGTNSLAPVLIASSPYKTIEEAASYIRVTPWTIAEAIRSGALNAKRAGKRFILTTQDLDEWYRNLEAA